MKLYEVMTLQQRHRPGRDCRDPVYRDDEKPRSRGQATGRREEIKTDGE
jgi:hypothetical protein